MTVSEARGLITQGGGGSMNEDELLATLPAAAVLTAIDIRGVAVSAVVAATIATGSFATLNFMTGLQWVTHGGSPFSVVNVPVASGNWLRFSEGTAYAEAPLEAQTGVSYQIYTQFALRERWRGNFRQGGSIDVYWSFGENQALSDTVSLRSFFSYRVRWATFP